MNPEIKPSGIMPVKPLAARRILVTRAPHQASELADRLRELGATPILIPAIEIAPPASFAALDAALACLRTYDWLVFTSANAVEAFHRRAQHQHLTQLPQKIAAIGPATERAANAIGLTVDLVPPQYTAGSLAQALLAQAPGKSFLLVRAAEGPHPLSDAIPEALTAAGGTVTIAEAYRNQTPQASVLALRELFGTPSSWPDAITFTSASTARNLAALLETSGLELPPAILRASIGPVTSAALRDLNLPPHLEAAEPTIASLIEALEQHLQQKPE
jgi:uroporphyrinogen-III synthase